MVETIEQAFEVLEKRNDGIPFEAIEYLYNHERNERINEKIIFHVSNAYNTDYYLEPETEYLLPTPLWYAIIAEKHYDERLIDPVISLFTKTTEDWDFLNEQGMYLIGLLSKRFPEIIIPKIFNIIDDLSDKNSELPYLFLFDCMYYADKEKYKEIILKILSKKEFTWYDSYAVHVSDLQIKEAIPIIQSKFDRGEKKKPDINEEFFIRELKFALEQLESEKIIYPDFAKPYFEQRGNWKEHYEKFIDSFTDEEEENIDTDNHYDDYDEDDVILPVRSEPKIQRNDPCPCGSGKKYKKCHGK